MQHPFLPLVPLNITTQQHHLVSVVLTYLIVLSVRPRPPLCPWNRHAPPDLGRRARPPAPRSEACCCCCWPEEQAGSLKCCDFLETLHRLKGNNNIFSKKSLAMMKDAAETGLSCVLSPPSEAGSEAQESWHGRARIESSST